MFYIKQYKWPLLFCLILLLVPYFILSAYTNPFADDFIYGQRGRDYQLITQALREYFNWSGRYTANLLQFLNPLAFDSFTGYKIFPAVLISLIVFSNLFFIHVLTGKQLGVVDKLILSLLLSLLFLHQMPILSEGIYWYAGAVVYQLGSVFAILYLSLLCLYTQKRMVLNNRYIHLVLITFLLAISIGFNEVMTLALLLFSTVSLIIVRIHKLQNQGVFIYIFCIAIVCTGITFFAPGNAVRSSLASNNHRFFYSIVMGLAQTARFFLKWICSVPLLVLSFLYYPLNQKLSESIPVFFRSFYLKPIVSLGVLVLGIFIASFPPYWATGMLGQHRTLNVAYYLFLIGWFINLTVFFNAFKHKFIVKPVSPRVYVLLMSLVLLAFVFTKNGVDVITDLLNGKACSYNAQMQKRYMLIQVPADTVYFPEIKDPPKSLFLYEVSKDPQNWLNRSYVIYFNCENKSIVKK